jgi:ribosomal peptide maturation radical SAM protein 1
MNMRPARLQFVVTPFLPEHQPALGVSSLAAVLRKNGIDSDIRYLNLEYGKLSGWSRYNFIGNALPVELLLGELLFAPALWGNDAPPFESFMAGLDRWQKAGVIRKRFPDLDETVNQLRPLYADSPNVVREWADTILAGDPTIVGFTTTFQQNVASLALAKELRRRRPAEELTILFGGANCEADMGRALADHFPFIDHVVSGEAEEVIVDLVESVASDTGKKWPRFVQGSMVRDMNALPEPEFASYFAAVSGTPWHGRANLVAESSRGCWWGAKSHCTFCGLNGGTMSYRSKEPGRFVEELRSLRRQYGTGSFMLADNIMDMKYVRRLFPELTADSEGIELFYETKANLRKEQLIAMAAGGVTRLQPGIESLSTSILKLMEKGTTALQNVQLLKWSEELHVGLAWNLLFGFPGEKPAEYDTMTALIGKLGHLPAPTGTGSIRLDRFSPYWRSPDQHGIKNLQPFWAYDLVYGPLPPEARKRIAYFFDYDYVDGRKPDTYVQPATAAVSRWQHAYLIRHATLELVTETGRTELLDSRFDDEPSPTLLTVSEATLLRVLDGIVHRDSILADLNVALAGDRSVSECDLAEMLERFLRNGWVVREGDLYLSIVLDRAEHRKIIDRRVEAQLAEFGLMEQPVLPLATGL